MSYFVVKNIHKTWETKVIEFSLECERGTMTCLLGPSGCGKSTVLNIIAGLEKNDDMGSPRSFESLRNRGDMGGMRKESGSLPFDKLRDREIPGPFTIQLDGVHLETLPPSKRNIGMVFQSGALFNHLTVEDNVAYGLITQGIKKRQARAQAKEYITLFGLSGFEKRMPQTLSGGEKQRVALARTLITQPKLVLLDEPFSALDTDLRHRMAAQLRQWQKELGFTAIMVTHDEEEAKTVADKIVRMG